MNRYCRQEILEFLPKNFQKQIKNKKLILVGCGGVGSVLAQTLVRGGFLNLTIIDNDKVDITNLNRQAFFEEDLDKHKATSLKKHLLKIDKLAKIKEIINLINKDNIDEICKDSDLIIDATDDFKTRKLINSYCEKNKKDWIYNGAIKTQVVSCIFKGKDKLFEKIFPNNIKEEKAIDVGILPSTTSMAASLGFNQTVKYFIEKPKNKETKIIKLDLWTNKIFEIKVK